MSKPREFWFPLFKDRHEWQLDPDVSTIYTSQQDAIENINLDACEVVHVIEKSAYDEMKKQREMFAKCYDAEKETLEARKAVEQAHEAVLETQAGCFKCGQLKCECKQA